MIFNFVLIYHGDYIYFISNTKCTREAFDRMYTTIQDIKTDVYILYIKTMCDRINYSNTTNMSVSDLVNVKSTQMILTIYLGILAVVGSIGNAALITYIVLQKQVTTHRIFLLGLAVSDFMVCCVTVPFEIIDVEYSHTFHSTEACKVFRSLNYLFIFTSILMLMALSLDRFLRVCKPLFAQISPKRAKIVILINIGIAITFSWPNIFFYGVRQIHLSNNSTGYDCTTAEEYESTKQILIYSTILCLLFVSFFVTLLIFYCMIGMAIFSHFRYVRQFLHAQDSNQVHRDHNEHVPVSRSQSQEGSSKKITKISFIISSVFVLSYSPILVSSVSEALLRRCYFYPQSDDEIFLQIVERFYIFNHVANPFIYCFLDVNFRQMIKNKMFNLCHRKENVLI